MAKLKLTADVSVWTSPRTHVEPFDVNSVPLAAKLMVDAYRGTVDWDDGDDETVAANEISNTIAGEYGEFVPTASVQIRHDNEVVSQLMCTIFDGEPLITFVYTHPEHVGHGHATDLIHAAGVALHKLQRSTLSLYVTDSNPALSLYKSLGFRPS